jgi:hypothetical protein
MSEKHTVKLYQWINGRLNVVIKEFNSLNESIFFCEQAEGDFAKVYTHDNHLVHESKCKKSEFYA